MGSTLAAGLSSSPAPAPQPCLVLVVQSRQEGVGESLRPLALSLLLPHLAVLLPFLSDVLC